MHVDVCMCLNPAPMPNHSALTAAVGGFISIKQTSSAKIAGVYLTSSDIKAICLSAMIGWQPLPNMSTSCGFNKNQEGWVVIRTDCKVGLKADGK